MPTKQADVAIVMVTYNGIHPACLPSVQAAMEQSALDVVLVLVDNASTEFDAYAHAKQHTPDARVILRNHNSGFGHACNRGAREVDARYYFFLNPDTELVDATTIDQLVAFLEAYPKVGIAAPRVCYMDGTHQQTARRFPAWFMPFMQRTKMANTDRGKAYRSSFLMEEADPSEVRPVDWVQGSAFLIDGDLFRDVGGFDERYFMYFEDVDLCRSCWQKGRPVYYVPDTRVHHVYGQGSAKESTAAKNLLNNRLARVHVESWLKYLKKWGLSRV